MYVFFVKNTEDLNSYLHTCPPSDYVNKMTHCILTIIIKDFMNFISVPKCVYLLHEGLFLLIDAKRRFSIEKVVNLVKRLGSLALLNLE